MKKSLKNKYVYIDIDGTLAEYRFNNHVSAKDGTSNGQTMQEIEEHIFLESRPLKSVIKTLKKSKYKGIWICGAIISPIELVDKIEWLNKKCKEIKFNGYFWFVPDEYWESFLEYFKCKNNEYDIVTEYGIIIKGSKTQMWDWLINHKVHKTRHCIRDDSGPGGSSFQACTFGIAGSESQHYSKSVSHFGRGRGYRVQSGCEELHSSG